MTTNQRSVGLSRIGERHFEVTNERGGRIVLGEGADAEFTPVELLLAAIAGCSAIDVDYLTTRRAEPESFAVTVSAEKLDDQDGHHLGPVTARFELAFPEGPDGDRARQALPTAVAASRDRLCTVSRTVQLPTPVVFEVGPA
jgi:putative redox protein